MADTKMTTESTIYVTYIAAVPERAWSALTSSEFTTRYFFGRTVESAGRRARRSACASLMARSTFKAKCEKAIRLESSLCHGTWPGTSNLRICPSAL